MKRNRQKAMALFRALLMAVSFTACGGSPGESGSDSTGSSNSVSAAEEGGQLPDSSSGNGGMDSTDVSGDRAELTMILINDGMEYPDTGKVGAAAAGIVKEKLDIDLSFKYLNFYDASTSLNLWLSSGEGCDIFQAGLEWNSFIDQGFLRDLTPYEELLPDAIKAAGVYLDCGISDGKLYVIPSVKDMVNYNCYFFRKDIVDAVQIDPDSVTSYEELGNLLRAIKAKYPELRPLVSDAGLSAGTIRMDNTYSPDGKKLIVPHIFDFGSSVGLMEPTVSSKVECLFMTDYYEDVVNMAYDWNQEGLIYFSDMSSGPEQVLAGTAAGGGGMYKPGAEVEWGTNAGCEVYAVCHPDPGDAVRTTSTGSNWSVSNGCSDVESACRLINLMFMDKEINNLCSLKYLQDL
ncbi:hypothetical protein AALA61_12505 [Oscillospiraceae bacterium 42-9]